MMNKLLLMGLGLLWGALVFWIGLRVTFPSDAAVARLQWEISERSDGRFLLTADEAGPWRLSGLSLEGVRLFSRPKSKRRARDEDEEGPAPSLLLSASLMEARLALLPLLTGTYSPVIHAELFGGSLDADMDWSDTLMGLETTIEDLDIGLIPIGGESFTLDLTGRLSSEISLALSREDMADSEGRGKLEIDDLVLVSGQVLGFDTPQDQQFSEARLAFEIEDAKAKITKGRLVGDMMDATFSGEITLNKKMERSRLRVEIAFSLMEELDNLVKLAPNAREARDDKGVYHFILTGTIDHPRLRPDRARTTSRRSRPERTPSMDRPDVISRPILDDMDDMDDEARRQLREERIKERRERLKERRDRLKQERDVDEDEEPQRGPSIRDDRQSRRLYDEDEEEPDDDVDFDDRFEDDQNGEPFEDDVDLQQVPYEDEEPYDYQE